MAVGGRDGGCHDGGDVAWYSGDGVGEYGGGNECDDGGCGDSDTGDDDYGSNSNSIGDDVDSVCGSVGLW